MSRNPRDRGDLDVCAMPDQVLKPRSSIRSALILMAVLAAGACGEESSRKADAPPRPVKVVRTVDATIIAGRALPGQARAAREAMLSFRVAGRMQERRVKPGDQVNAGDIVATLDPAPYKAELDRAAANLQRARAAHANTAGQLERDRQLLAKDIIARARFDNSDAAAKQALAEVKSLEAAHERAKLDLGYTELRAPFAGIVSAVFAEAHEEIKPQESIMRLIDPTAVEMIVNVPESLIPIAPHVVELRASFDAFPGVEIPAEISEIGAEPSANTRTYPVKVLLVPPKDVAILPGMAGRLRGKPGPKIAQQLKGVVVPLSAVFSPDDDKGSFVWVASEETKTVKRQKVTLGEPVIGGVSVIDGLAPGSLIVTAGVNSLRQDQPVRIIEADDTVTP